MSNINSICAREFVNRCRFCQSKRFIKWGCYWRKCKSVVDEILGLLNLVGGLIPGGNIPLPLLFVSQLLGGYSETRAFIGTIEELQKLGIPTGDLPDGSPNLSVLAMFGQMKAMAKEEVENNKVQIAVGPLVVSPAGLTIPANAFGKKV